MKVLCIQETNSVEPGIKPVIEVGGIYNVIKTFEWSCGVMYELAEHIGVVYISRLFAPLSDKDETEYADQILEQISSPVGK